MYLAKPELKWSSWTCERGVWVEASSEAPQGHWALLTPSGPQQALSVRSSINRNIWLIRVTQSANTVRAKFLWLSRSLCSFQVPGKGVPYVTPVSHGLLQKCSRLEASKILGSVRAQLTMSRRCSVYQQGTTQSFCCCAFYYSCTIMQWSNGQDFKWK